MASMVINGETVVKKLLIELLQVPIISIHCNLLGVKGIGLALQIIPEDEHSSSFMNMARYNIVSSFSDELVVAMSICSTIIFQWQEWL
jgi:hypothetical protein